MGFKKDLLFLGLVCALVKCGTGCDRGFENEKGGCADTDECKENIGLCGNNSDCINTNGSYYCRCHPGYENVKGSVNFTASDGQCKDVNECLKNICGPNAKCHNTIGSFNCTCHSGYANVSNSCEDVNECHNNTCGPNASCHNTIGSFKCNCDFGYTEINNSCEDIDECQEDKKKEEYICGEKGTCENLNGSYLCKCQEGYTNYGKERMPCSELKCNSFSPKGGHPQTLKGLEAILFMMRNSCLALSSSSAAGEGKAEGDTLLEKLFTATDEILSPRQLNNSKDVSGLLSTVEKSILLIGPQLKGNHTKIGTTETGIDAEIAVRRGRTPPTGPVHLTSENASLDTDWTTAAGTEKYPGFALAALLSYKNLEKAMNHSFDEIKTNEDEDSVEPTVQVFSKVVSVVVSNPSTDNLSRHVNITLRHLQDTKEKEDSVAVRYICAYWDESGAWSTRGLVHQYTNTNDSYTVCTFNHLSSFAVLMARYPMKHTFGLLVATKIGLIVSLLCLILCILTFMFCRSIKGTRTTIHLHLCICLFMADLVFLAGISQTKPEGGCKFVAALLHFFFLGVFTWMLLEGVQLYRMVVLVFNASIRPLYLYVTGYGAPLVIVMISGSIRSQGYGTKEHCWLSLEDGLIWSFFGPVCVIIILNVFFFIITVWRLAQKFASLNPDLSKLHKIKAFTVTAIAQMCILGLMWVFGAFLFEEEPTAVAYIFTILNSLQGALVFVMHCLLSKQVRDEYAHFLSCICTKEKKKYSDFSSTNPSSSQSQALQSGQHTGESNI